MIATVTGNFGPIGTVDSVPKNSKGPFKKLEESSDADRNAGQHSAGPYMSELRRNGLREEPDSKTPGMAQNDPLGRGSLFDSVA